jgi:hypothetical protein
LDLAGEGEEEDGMDVDVDELEEGGEEKQGGKEGWPSVQRLVRCVACIYGWRPDSTGFA